MESFRGSHLGAAVVIIKTVPCHTEHPFNTFSAVRLYSSAPVYSEELRSHGQYPVSARCGWGPFWVLRLLQRFSPHDMSRRFSLPALPPACSSGIKLYIQIFAFLKLLCHTSRASIAILHKIEAIFFQFLTKYNCQWSGFPLSGAMWWQLCFLSSW